MRFIKAYARKWKNKITFVLPDCPFDPDYFTGSQYENNIRKTYTYHTMFIKYCENVYKTFGTKFILVIQHRQNLYDVDKSALIIQDMLNWIDKDMVYAIGVGSLCVNKSPKEIAKYINEVGRLFSKTKIHGFGIKLNTIKYLNWNIVNRFSFDGTGWTRPVNSKILKILNVDKRYSCKNEIERIIYFIIYIARICEYFSMYSIANELIQIAEKIVQRKTNGKIKIYPIFDNVEYIT